MLTRLVGLIGDPVSGSRSPRMQNAAFHACELDWAYVLLPTRAEALERTVAGLVELDFAGANVTTPHKLAVASLCETELVSVNTLVVSDGRVEGHSTDAAILAGLPARAAGDRRRGRRGGRLSRRPSGCGRLLPQRHRGRPMSATRTSS